MMDLSAYSDCIITCLTKTLAIKTLLLHIATAHYPQLEAIYQIDSRLREFELILTLLKPEPKIIQELFSHLILNPRILGHVVSLLFCQLSV